MISFGPTKKLTIAISIVITLATILCVLISKSVVRYAESHEHQHLKEIVDAMLPSLDVEKVRHLTGSPADTNTFHYNSIKSSLVALRDINPSYSFVYLMGIKDGEIVFLADAEAEDSDDFSPPGQVYPGASGKLHLIFKNGQSFVEGPITDEWGRWMSAHAAIKDEESGKVLAILGLDIDASRWVKATGTYSLLSNIIILLIILMASTFTFAMVRIVRDRDNILSVNNDLQNAREELLQKERLAVMGQLNAVVSHELRNPLGTISNATFLMKDAIDSSDKVKGEKAIQLIERNIDRCNRIVEELLAFSKVNNSFHERLEIDPWLDGLITKDLLPENVLLQKDLNVNLSINADPDRLQRAIDNVWQNAVHALTEKDGGTPTLKIKTSTKSDRLEIVIKDNGPGMSSETMSKIMNPMFSTKTFGVGLGLPIVQNIMSDHGGGMKVESVVDEGTTITLWLPLSES